MSALEAFGVFMWLLSGFLVWADHIRETKYVNVQDMLILFLLLVFAPLAVIAWIVEHDSILGYVVFDWRKK